MFAATDLTFVGFITVKDVAHQTRATGQVLEVGLKADQAARRDAVFQAHAAAAVGLHVHQVALAHAQLVHHTALVAVFNVHRQQLHGFVFFAADVVQHDARARHGQLVTFAAHVFQEDGQVQFAPT